MYGQVGDSMAVRSVTHPVEVFRTSVQSLTLYAIPTPKVKEETKPIIRVLSSAYGTILAALRASSATWIAPSIPAKI